MIREDTLLSDQVFQLNTFIWALEDLPDASEVRPVLRDAGYFLTAIGCRVIVPPRPQIVAALGKLTGSDARSPCRPDLWLEHSKHAVHLVVELKARGFSPASSNRRQALKLIAAAADLADSLAGAVERPGHVVYATIATDADALATTLDELANSLKTEGIPTAPTGVIGLSVESEGVALSSPSPSDLPEPAAVALANPAIVLSRNGSNDLQPLYLIPWIPGIENSQDSDLHTRGLNELTARVLTHAIGQIGRAPIPTKLSLEGNKLLQGATFGVFDHWKDSDRTHFSKKAVDIVAKAVRSDVETRTRRRAPDCLEIDLSDSEKQDRAIELLLKAEPASPKDNLESAFHEQLPFLSNLEYTRSAAK